MRLQLDPTNCDGYGICAQLLPEVISRDPWGFPIIGQTDTGTGFERDRRSAEVHAELHHLAHRAVVSCPKFALRLGD